MPAPIYILAGGGTGGHLYPALAVAEELLRIQPEARIVFACSQRPIDRRILNPLPYAVVAQPVCPLPRRPREVPGFLWSWWRSSLLARDMIADVRPAAVLGLGGFAAGPVICRAAKAGLPVGLLNPDAVPGKANRFLATKADVIFTQFAATAKSFPSKLRGRIRCTGCPIRPSLVKADRSRALRHFQLREDRRTLLVFGGSLLAEALSEALELLAADLALLASTWQVLHITASPRAGEIEAALARHGLAVRTQGYCGRMDLAYAAADLVLSRAGAVTVAELAATGSPAVLMPYPYHADEHQRLNAAALADAEAAMVCADVGDAATNAASLRELMVPLMRDRQRLEAMRRAAAGLGKPNAARDVAAWLAGAGQPKGGD
jgi:UDP-N-acetylglucosamine--N-acetylmuramyl-(pentapeptide) pyrophosphoryl-undecaprenol N-acetylglucosamine transferase